MTIGFKTTKKGYKNMIAASHIADRSARPLRSLKRKII